MMKKHHQNGRKSSVGAKTPRRAHIGRADTPKVAILMGSDSDLPTMRAAGEALEKFGVAYEFAILSAHRAPDAVAELAKGARDQGIRVIIAGAGGAAHLPGVIAAYTELPVIGVPVMNGPLQGQDALLSIVQMPKGIPVATVAIGSAWNAGVLAAQMIGAGGLEPNHALLDRVAQYKIELRDAVLAKNAEVKTHGKNGLRVGSSEAGGFQSGFAAQSKS